MGFYIIYTGGNLIPPDNPNTLEVDPMYITDIHNAQTILHNNASVWYDKTKKDKNID